MSDVMTWNWYGNAGAMPLGRNGSNASTGGGFIADDDPVDTSSSTDDQQPPPPTDDPNTNYTSST